MVVVLIEWIIYTILRRGSGWAKKVQFGSVRFGWAGLDFLSPHSYHRHHIVWSNKNRFIWAPETTSSRHQAEGMERIPPDGCDGLKLEVFCTANLLKHSNVQ